MSKINSESNDSTDTQNVKTILKLPKLVNKIEENINAVKKAKIPTKKVYN